MPRPPGMMLVSILLLVVCIFGTYWLSALPDMREQHQAQTDAAPDALAPAAPGVVPRTHRRRVAHVPSTHHHAATTARATTHEASTLTAPHPVYAPPPSYPISALRTHRQGQVTLRLTLAPDGHVATVHVVRSSGDAALDEAAHRTLGSWIFPPPRDGTPRAFDWPVRFRIDSHD